MCKVQMEVYEKDNEWLGKLKQKYRLQSRAAVLELIVKLIKQNKMEGELR